MVVDPEDDDKGPPTFSVVWLMRRPVSAHREHCSDQRDSHKLGGDRESDPPKVIGSGAAVNQERRVAREDSVALLKQQPSQLSPLAVHPQKSDVSCAISACETAPNH